MSFSKKPEHNYNDSIPSELVYDGLISRYSASLHCNKLFFSGPGFNWGMESLYVMSYWCLMFVILEQISQDLAMCIKTLGFGVYPLHGDWLSSG